MSPLSDPDGDGWGWENSMSCVVSPNDQCIDTDGDGWGWDGTMSCRIDYSDVIVITDCIDEDGDGYGWDGISTCVPFVEPTIRECVDTEPLGDTWGWNGIESCRVAPILTGGDTSAIAGIWDISFDDGFSTESYLIISPDGLLGSIGKDPDSDCYFVEEPRTGEGSTVFTPIDRNVYRIDYIEYDYVTDQYIVESEFDTIYVTEANTLRIISEFDGETETFELPAANININEIERCDDAV